MRLQRQHLVYALLVLLPFERIPSWSVWGITLRPSIVVGLVLIVMTVIQKPRAFWPDSRIKQALAAFMAVNLLSAGLSQHAGRALAVTGFLGFTVAVGLSVAVAVPEIEWKAARRALVAGAVVVCGLALYQFFGDLAGLPNQLTGLRTAYSSGVFGFPRVQAASLEPLYLANYLLLPLSIISLTLLAGGIGFGLLALFYTVFLLTLSRGGVAAAAVVTAASCGFGWYGRRQEAFKIAGALAVALAVAYSLLAVVVPALHHQSLKQAVTAYDHQLTNYDPGGTNIQRTRTRQLAWQEFKLHPLLGAGPGTFGYFAHAADSHFPIRQIVNNELFELLAETGVVGFFTLGLFALLLAIAAIKTLPTKLNQTWAWQLGLLIFLAAAGVQYWSFSTLYVIHIWVAIGLLMGLIQNGSGRQSKPPALPSV